MPKKVNKIRPNTRSKSTPTKLRRKPTMSERKVVTAPGAPTSPEPLESLDKVRDILFGAQSRDFENRFAFLEEKLLQETSRAKDDAQKRFEALEVNLKNQVQQLTDKIKAENAERGTAVKSLTSEIKQLTQTLDKKIEQLGSSSGKELIELREHLMGNSSSLSEEIKRRCDDINAKFNVEVSELENDKLNRSDIAGLFNDMAQKLLAISKS
jgi:ElaB/YqjD/DUF883 family membrane-anchored ribosome-binding protein